MYMLYTLRGVLASSNDCKDLRFKLWEGENNFIGIDNELIDFFNTRFGYCTT